MLIALLFTLALMTASAAWYLYTRQVPSERIRSDQNSPSFNTYRMFIIKSSKDWSITSDNLKAALERKFQTSLQETKVRLAQHREDTICATFALSIPPSHFSLGEITLEIEPIKKRVKYVNHRERYSPVILIILVDQGLLLALISKELPLYMTDRKIRLRLSTESVQSYVIISA